MDRIEHISSKEIYEMVIADLQSDKILSDGKICMNCGDDIRIRLLFNHTWIEYCPQCGSQSPQKPKVTKGSLSQNNKKETIL